jgi:CMP-N,N'-diacetyllegionaminic acid synthase
MNTVKVLSIIPARAGSKGIANKNIIDLYGKPLLVWSIEASLNSKYISKTVVSSNGDAILKIAEEFGAEMIKRPQNLAQDASSSEAVIEHMLQTLGDDLDAFEYLILLQPTSPLRDHNDIDNAFEMLLNSDADALISVYEEDNKILKAFKENSDGYIEGIANNEYPFMPRQELPSVYMSNGAIYIIKISEFLKSKKLFCEKTIAYTMSKEKSLDIDTREDLEKAKLYMESTQYE